MSNEFRKTSQLRLQSQVLTCTPYLPHFHPVDRNRGRTRLLCMCSTMTWWKICSQIACTRISCGVFGFLELYIADLDTFWTRGKNAVVKFLYITNTIPLNKGIPARHSPRFMVLQRYTVLDQSQMTQLLHCMLQAFTPSFFALGNIGFSRFLSSRSRGK